MKRTLAFIITSVLFLTIAPDAFAQSLGVNPTRWGQPRVSQRSLKRATLASYWHRWNLSYRRDRYRNIVARVMQGIPSTLAVTGAGRSGHPDYLIADRPGTRELGQLTLDDHCISDDSRYNDVNVAGKKFCEKDE